MIRKGFKKKGGRKKKKKLGFSAEVTGVGVIGGSRAPTCYMVSIQMIFWASLFNTEYSRKTILFFFVNNLGLNAPFFIETGT